MYLGVDYMLRSDAAYPAFKEKGVGFVCRYLCPPKWPKRLTAEEAKSLSDAGFNIVSVWEDNPVKASWFTPARGVTEATMAVEMARLAGQPEGAAIYFAVDYDAQPEDFPALDAYFRAVQEHIGPYKVGVYGGYRVIDHYAEKLPFLWQTYAWSGVRVHPKAQLYQYRNGVLLGGVDVDLNRCFSDPGWWRIGGALVPPPFEEVLESVPTLRRGDSGLAVYILQAMLNAHRAIHTALRSGPGLVLDGKFGQATRDVVVRFQASVGLEMDGIVGPKTWNALVGAFGPGEQADVMALVAELQNRIARAKEALG